MDHGKSCFNTQKDRTTILHDFSRSLRVSLFGDCYVYMIIYIHIYIYKSIIDRTWSSMGCVPPGWKTSYEHVGVTEIENICNTFSRNTCADQSTVKH